MEADETTYRTLLESTKAIPWRIDWASTRFTYIGPQIEALLGWPQASWRTVEEWAARIHVDDRERVVSFCVAQSQAGVDHEADYRAETADGSYVWIRDVVHVVRNGDEVEALVGFMFDISDRKRNEDELARLQRELEALSYKDGLTDVANRRRFDQVLAAAWETARLEAQPLSLLLVDIDYFKQFNDRHGHLAGDDSLKRIASLLTSSVRPGDLVARIGGEEFAVLMPRTDSLVARTVADRCRGAVLDERIAHGASEASPYLTVSVGLRSIVPEPDQTPRDFVEAVDRLLYQAKSQGRNRVVARASSRPPR